MTENGGVFIEFKVCYVAFLDPCHTPPASHPRKESIRGEEDIGREAKHPLQRQGILYERIQSIIYFLPHIYII